MTKPAKANPTPEKLFAEAVPTALNLIMETSVCKQCRRRYRAPSSEPLVQLSARRTHHHIRLSQYPYQIPEGLPRHVIEVEATIEYCEHCFTTHDPRQDELFHAGAGGAEVLPLPFNGKPVLETKARAKPSAPTTKPVTLEDF